MAPGPLQGVGTGCPDLWISVWRNELRIATAWILLISQSYPTPHHDYSQLPADQCVVRTNVFSNFQRPILARWFLQSIDCVSTIYFLSYWLSSVACHFEQILAPRIFALFHRFDIRLYLYDNSDRWPARARGSEEEPDFINPILRLQSLISGLGVDRSVPTTWILKMMEFPSHTVSGQHMLTEKPNWWPLRFPETE